MKWITRILILLFVLGHSSLLLSKEERLSSIRGGIALDLPGVKFTPPSDKVWYVVKQQSHEIMLAMKGEGEYEHETLAIISGFYRIDNIHTGDELLAFVKDRPSNEPGETRFEDILNESSISTKRNEVCAQYNVLTKDHERKRNKKIVLFHKIGMFCLYPFGDNVVSWVEISRQAPIGDKNEQFEEYAEQLKQSVIYKP